MAPTPQKLVVVGEGACGKTRLSLSSARTSSRVLRPYLFGELPHYVVGTEAAGKQVELACGTQQGRKTVITAGLSSTLTKTSALIDSPDSLGNLPEKWTLEVKHPHGQ